MIIIFKWLLLNIHTILLIVGIAFLAVAAFLYSQIAGFVVLGSGCILLGMLINHNDT